MVSLSDNSDMDKDFWLKSFYSHEKSEEWVRECLGVQVGDLVSNYDKALATKISWWFKYYIDPILAFKGEDGYLASQFGIIVSIAAIEAMLNGAENLKPAWRPVLKFCLENLSESDQEIIANGIDWSDDRSKNIKHVIRELVARRNGFLHGLYLPNLNKEDNLFVLTYSQYEYRENKKHVRITIRITPEQIAEKTKIAITNYFRKKIDRG